MNYSVKAVARLTGLTPDTLRAWERRHGVVAPERSPNGRRSYNRDQVNRLRLLHDAVRNGHSIGKLAGLLDDDLHRLLETPEETSAHRRAAETLTRQLLACVEVYDADGCDRIMGLAMASLAPLELVQDVLSPALFEVGERWHRNTMSVAQERILSSSVRRLVTSVVHNQHNHGRRPGLLFGTLSGERHELGSLCAAFLAGMQGLRCRYLGPEVPAVEMAQMAKQTDATVICIGITMADEACVEQFQKLCDTVADQAKIWIGGSAAKTVAHRGGENAELINDLMEFEDRLRPL